MSLEFTRYDEEEADRVGFKLMKEQRRDPEEMVSMLHTMHKSSKIRMGNIPQYLLTHPKPELRMSYVQDLIQVQGRGDYKKFDQFQFHRMQKRVNALTIEPQKLFGRYKKAYRNATTDYDKMILTLVKDDERQELPRTLPINILGGSPTRVAIPPILEARISAIKNGTGLTRSVEATNKVTGAIKTTMVT